MVVQLFITTIFIITTIQLSSGQFFPKTTISYLINFGYKNQLWRKLICTYNQGREN